MSFFSWGSFYFAVALHHDHLYVGEALPGESCQGCTLWLRGPSLCVQEDVPGSGKRPLWLWRLCREGCTVQGSGRALRPGWDSTWIEMATFSPWLEWLEFVIIMIVIFKHKFTFEKRLIAPKSSISVSKKLQSWLWIYIEIEWTNLNFCMMEFQTITKVSHTKTLQFGFKLNWPI